MLQKEPIVNKFRLMYEMAYLADLPITRAVVLEVESRCSGPSPFTIPGFSSLIFDPLELSFTEQLLSRQPGKQ